MNLLFKKVGTERAKASVGGLRSVQRPFASSQCYSHTVCKVRLHFFQAAMAEDDGVHTLRGCLKQLQLDKYYPHFLAKGITLENVTELRIQA